MRSARAILLLWLIWTATNNARRVKIQNVGELKLFEQAQHGEFSNTSVIARANNQTQILCFGLCIAALGGLGLFFIIGLGGAGTVAIGFTTKAVINHLKDVGVEAEQIMGVVAEAAKWASISREEVEGEKNRLAWEAVTPVPWTPQSLLDHIRTTCGAFMEAKGLGESATSSKSGAVFFNCDSPEPTDEHPRMLVKGAIRDSDSSPEWQIFQKFARDPALQVRYSSRTLLNRMVLGFDAYSLHWLVLEDIKASHTLHKLREDLNLVFLNEVGNKVVEGLPKFDAFDIKPAGSRAPQLPKCAQRLEAVAAVMGPIHEFKGWYDIVGTLELDLKYLQGHSVIDESLFVQVAGPFKVDRNRVNQLTEGEDQILKVLQGTPMCAYQVKRDQMAIICFSILDYILSMSTMKSIQNVFQFSRWNDYEVKMTTLLSCLGDLAQEQCTNFKSMSTGQWLAVVKAEYDEHYKIPSVKAAMDHLESNYRCCCNTEETEGKLTMSTICAWLSRTGPEAQVTSWGYCPGNLQHYSAANGGCMDVEPPPLPPPEPSTRCSFYHSCCCYHRDYVPHDHLPVEANGLCNCQWSCPRNESYGSYKDVDYCPVIYNNLKRKSSS